MRLIDRLELGWRRRVPVVLQTEASECGLACLAMVLGHHGTVVDLPSMRGRHGAVPQGMTLLDVARVASVEQLTTRSLRVELHELRELKLPCILHWDLSHFVVLSEIRGDRFIVLDPAVGERRLSEADLSSRFTGVAVEAWPSGGFMRRRETQAISIRHLVGRVSGLWPMLWRVLSVSLALEVLALVSPLFMQWIMDNVIVSRDMGLLTTLGIGFLLLMVLEQLFGVVRSWMVLRLGTQLQVQWRSNVLSHMLRLPLDYFARRHLGDVMSRFGSIGHIQSVLTGTFVEAALDGLMVVFALVLMLLYSPLLTGVALVAVLLYTVIRLLSFRPLRLATAEHLVRSASESSHLLETVRGMRTIRLFAREEGRLSAWQSLMVGDINANLHIQKIEIVNRLIRRLVSGTFSILILWMGARVVLANELSMGMLLAFLAYRSQFDNRFTELVNKIVDLRMLGVHAQRLADIVLTPAEKVTSPGGVVSAEVPDIELSDLYFRHANGSPDVLSGLTLKIPAGQSVAISGPSGCGKSTLINVLLGVYTPQRGVVQIGGVPLQDMGVENWRGRVGTVMQDDVLFAGSIADNIAFFDPNADRQWIEKCAQMAAIHDDIARMPMAYQTLVGDMGTTLSGGQKQRILLARAFYRRPQVLILDEATSHLDSAREAQVGRAIASMNLTRVIVAHRVQTLASVDRVVELKGGRVVRDETSLEFSRRLGFQLSKVSA